MDGWVGGWVGGSKSHFKDCLQQSKINKILVHPGPSQKFNRYFVNVLKH
jgi:hypothetical protein